MKTTQGTRTTPHNVGYSGHDKHHGDYWLNTHTGWWAGYAPDGSAVCLDPAIHKTVEHENGTISVTPSIKTPTWHGWLKEGVWIEC